MTIHVFPTDDWIDHHVGGDQFTCDCPCEPHVEVLVVVYHDVVVSERVMIIHNQVRPEDPAPDPWYVRLWAWLKRCLYAHRDLDNSEFFKE